MFNELSYNEMENTNGGVLPVAIPVIVKGAILIGTAIFVAGSVKGCTDEAAK